MTADLATINAEDEELMGELNLDEFLPTNEELRNEAYLNRMGSIMDFDVPKLSTETLQKLEHFGHQEVEYQKPKFSQSLAPAINPSGGDTEDDIFNVDFPDEGKGTTPLGNTAPAKLQSPPPKIIEPKNIEKSQIEGGSKQPSFGSGEKAMNRTKGEEEDEEELLVLSNIKSKQQRENEHDNSPPLSRQVPEITNAATPSSKANPVLTPVKLLSPTSLQASSPDKIAVSPGETSLKEKSRDDTLPGKLQKKVSEARLLQDHSIPTGINQDEDDDAMMTDIEQILLNEQPIQQKLQQQKHHYSDTPSSGQSNWPGDSNNNDEAEDEENLDEDVEEFEVMERKPSSRYLRTRNHEEDNNFYQEDDEALGPKKDFGKEPKLPNKSKETDKDYHQNADRPPRKSKLLVSQDGKRSADQEMEYDENNGGDENANQSRTGHNKTRPYAHPMNQGKFTVGNRTLTVAEAKLYGLLDADGQFISASSALGANATNVSGSQQKKHLMDMARPRSPTSNNVWKEMEEEACTFQPQRSANALKAMRNPKLGYDFVDRLATGGDFLQRLDKDNHKKIAGVSMSKAEQRCLEEDYAARLDKLTCPQCGKEQSFDEYLERSRLCRLCNVKYTKANVSSGLRFLQQNAAREAARQRRLQRVESEMYGDVGVTKMLAGGNKSKPAPKNRNNNGENKLFVPPSSGGDCAEGPLPPAVSTTNISNNKSVISNNAGNLNGNQPTRRGSSAQQSAVKPHPPSLPSSSATSGSTTGLKRPLAGTRRDSSAIGVSVDAPLAANQNATAAVETMRRLHNQQAQELNKFLSHLTASGGAVGENIANQADATQHEKHASTNKKGSSGNNISKKMDRLMQLD